MADKTCPECGGDAAHSPKATASLRDPRVTVHHPGPEYIAPVTVYLRVTVQPSTKDGISETELADAAAKKVGHIVIGDTRYESRVGWAASQWDRFSDEAPRPEPLPCGCTDLDEHREGVEMQAQYQKAAGRNACVGCFIGDDGPSMHSCVVHDRRYWPMAVPA